MRGEKEKHEGDKSFPASEVTVFRGKDVPFQSPTSLPNKWGSFPPKNPIKVLFFVLFCLSILHVLTLLD